MTIANQQSLSSSYKQVLLPDLLAIPVRRRRTIFAALVSITILGSSGLMLWTLSAGGLSMLDLILIALFIIALPFNAEALWNAVISFVLSRYKLETAEMVYPAIAKEKDSGPLYGSTAIVSCIRNEDISEACRKLDLLLEDLSSLGSHDKFSLFILSDTSWRDLIPVEEAHVKDLASKWSAFPIVYRRRSNNTGFKAGNIRDFCDNLGQGYDYMLVLDADSLMTAEVIYRMVRTMDGNRELGILQTTMSGLPTTSAFARPMQFGLRLLIHGYTSGKAWWQQDEGPYWGHNALIRLEPFKNCCRLPKLSGLGPLSGWILSHDHAEAALMRRAGYDVRVMVVNSGSWEETPPTLIEYLRRDLRWCRGNLQYFRLLPMRGLTSLTRVNLIFVNSGFIGSVAWVLFMILLLLSTVFGIRTDFNPAPGAAVFLLSLGMAFAPKLSSLLSIYLDGKYTSYGGIARFSVSAALEMMFSVLLAPVLAVGTAYYVFSLLFCNGRSWSVARRSLHSVSFLEGLISLWPQTLIGVLGMICHFLYNADGNILFSSFYIILCFSVPLTTASSSLCLGRYLGRLSLFSMPEEIVVPRLLMHGL